MVPQNSLKTDLALSSGISACSLMTHKYSFPDSRIAWTILVASSKAMGRTPVTLGFPRRY